MAVLPHTVEAVAAPVRKPRAAPRRGVAGGVIWIVCVAALLAGVVALNVAVLRLNMGVDRLDRQKTQLRFENQALASELSSAAAAARIENRARAAGLVPAGPDATSYVDLFPH
ncbi:MAG TPA: hypothetical protein VGF23_25885 [Gaiellaceae bacterium]